MSNELEKERKKRNGIKKTCNTISKHIDEFIKISKDIQTKELSIDDYEELFELMFCHLDCAIVTSKTLEIAPRIIDSITPSDEDMHEFNRLSIIYELLHTRIYNPSAFVKIN